ncbi:MAG: hypothetical protein VCA12_20645 [Pseudomonadales bacterium]
MSIIFRVKLSGWILFVVRKQNAGMAAEINLPESRRQPLAESAAEFIVSSMTRFDLRWMQGLPKAE